MVLERGGALRKHTFFRDLETFLPPASLLVVNDARVIPARLTGRKPTGGAMEILLTRKVDARHDEGDRIQDGLGDGSSEVWEALARGLSGGQAPSHLTFGALHVQVLERRGNGRFLVRLTVPGGGPAPRGSLLSVLEEVGEVPLPPYIVAARRQAAAQQTSVTGDAAAEDRQRYQTVYAASPGAVAAPTAGLHFTDELLGILRAAGHQVAPLTLHVGPGTFRPVETEDARAHEMDEEDYLIPQSTADAVNRARQEGRAVVAVGTTVVRTLESAARVGDGIVRGGAGASRLFLAPGDPFLVVSDLITNFHLPRSTLLMLVAAFAGREVVLDAYRDAIVSQYRFYSYGDAMLIRSPRSSARK